MNVLLAIHRASTVNLAGQDEKKTEKLCLE